MNQFCQLSGVKSVVPSPTCVGKVPGVSGSDDEFKNKVDRLVNHFMNEVVRVIMIHLGQYGSMEIHQADVEYAIEQFAKNQVRGPSLYMQIDANDGDDDDEWISEEDDNSEQDMDFESDMEEEHSDEDSDDDDDGPWLTKPSHCSTSLFDTVFPPMAQNSNFYQITNNECIHLAKQIMQTRYRCDIHFYEDSEETLKEALCRYILVECLKNN